MVTLALVTSFAIGLAFRTDYLEVDVYHLAYFIDVIFGLQNGLQLLVNQPSQYGFLNLQIAALFSGDA